MELFVMSVDLISYIGIKLSPSTKNYQIKKMSCQWRAPIEIFTIRHTKIDHVNSTGYKHGCLNPPKYYRHFYLTYQSYKTYLKDKIKIKGYVTSYT